MPDLLRLIDVFNKLDEFEMDHALYLKAGEKWDLNSVGAVIDPDEAEDPDGEYFDFRDENNLTYVLEVSIIDQIKNNAEYQLGKVTLEQLLDAFRYYFQHDAFKDWSK